MASVLLFRVRAPDNHALDVQIRLADIDAELIALYYRAEYDHRDDERVADLMAERQRLRGLA